MPYFTILEGLAHARYRGNKSPGEALGSFVVTYCGWSDGERVSLPHLVAALERTGDTAFDRVRQTPFDSYRAWGSGGPITFGERPDEQSGPNDLAENSGGTRKNSRVGHSVASTSTSRTNLLLSQ